MSRPYDNAPLPEPLPDAGAAYADPSAPQAGPGLLHQVHQLLRGRYHWAILLPLLLGPIGAFAGWKIKLPEFTSTATIRIKPVLPTILFTNSDVSGGMPAFESYLGSQMALITSQRVVDMAMQDPKWQELGRGLGPEQVGEFTGALSVDRPRASELILVSFSDPDPAVAQRAVQSVVRAYQNLYGESDSESGERRMQILEDRRTELSAQHKNLNGRVLAIATELGTSSLDKMLDFKLDEVNKLESQLREFEAAVAIAKGGDGSTTLAATPAEEPTFEQLTAASPELREALTERRDLAKQLAQTRIRLRDQHPEVQNLEAMLVLAGKRIDDLTREARGMAVAAASPGLNLAGRGLDRLQADEQNLRQLYDRTKAETLALGRRAVEVESLRAEMADVKRKLDETDKRIEAIRLEAKIGGRLEIISDGDRPISPAKDKRAQLAAVGGLGAAGLGLGLVMLMGFMDRRVRGITDVEQGTRRSSSILGVLPSLPEDLADPDQAMLAAHGVHQIRTTLMAKLANIQRPVVAITSPSPGSGKTSLTVALGLSLAGSGSKTLLLDCDMVGAGLTTRMKKITRRRLGHILRREGLVTSEQITEALREARAKRRRIGETLVELGYVTPADIDHALTVQQESLVGLQEALDGEPVDECITGTGTPGLYMMPVGSAGQQHIGRLSHAALRKLIEQVRNWFDIILVDTGPILGSLEAPMVAMAADASVMVVACGEQRPMVERATDLLIGTGCPLAGVVLNRADALEMVSGSYAPSISRMSVNQRNLPPRSAAPVEHRYLELGPIGNAVASNNETTDTDKVDVKPD